MSVPTAREIGGDVRIVKCSSGGVMHVKVRGIGKKSKPLFT
jgi:hypothetical protein